MGLLSLGFDPGSHAGSSHASHSEVSLSDITAEPLPCLPQAMFPSKEMFLGFSALSDLVFRLFIKQTCSFSFIQRICNGHSICDIRT